MQKVIFLTCWGTIDKDYGVWKGIYDVEPWSPIAWKVLDKNLVNWDYEVVEVLRKDSLDMNDEDRNKVKQELSKINNDKIIITHWTDTMIQTWKALWNIEDKVIILVGAARPYSMKNSDAEFNLWYALWVLDILSKNKQYWVYITMNWEVFDVNNVKKWEDWVFRKIND